LSGKEYLASSQTQSEVSARIVIRYHASIDSTWRVINDTHVYSIMGIVNHNEKDHMMDLMCSVGVLEQGQIPDDDSGFTVFNSSGQSFSVGRAVLDADGNAFNVI
jgi:hypothetical protein